MQCPFCKEEIQEGAIKCKHCGSMLTGHENSIVERGTEIAPQSSKSNIFGIVAIVIGGLSVVLPVVISWLTAVIGITMATVALARKENKKMSIIGLILSVTAVIFVLNTCSQVGKSLRSF